MMALFYAHKPAAGQVKKQHHQQPDSIYHPQMETRMTERRYRRAMKKQDAGYYSQTMNKVYMKYVIEHRNPAIDSKNAGCPAR